MAEISNYSYLSESDELYLFIVGTGQIEIDKSLNAMAKEKPKEIIEKYRKYFKGVEEKASTEEIMKYVETIENFQKFCVKEIKEITTMKDTINKMKETCDQEIKGHSESLVELLKFEEIANNYYSDQNDDAKVLSDPKHELQSKLLLNKDLIKNPFRDAFLWIKGELMDLEGMNHSYSGLESLKKQRKYINDSKIRQEQEVNNMKEGKKTMKSFFKSKTKKEAEIAKFSEYSLTIDQEIAEFDTLINFIYIYHANQGIPKFKKSKAKLYLQAMQSFSQKEVSNMHHVATMHHQLL